MLRVLLFSSPFPNGRVVCGAGKEVGRTAAVHALLDTMTAPCADANDLLVVSVCLVFLCKVRVGVQGRVLIDLAWAYRL